MFWTNISTQAPLFFLIVARVFAMIMVTPLFSSSGVPGVARVGLVLMVSAMVLPQVNPDELMFLGGSVIPGAGSAVLDFGLEYVFLLIGEALIGIIQGFFILLVGAAFQTAGQFFSTQMGFGASSVFDPLAQEEVPLMGQFFYLVAMLMFLLIDGFQKMFFTGVLVSFQAVRAADLVRAKDLFLPTFAGGLGMLFQQALSMAFPIFGTLFMVSITTGLLAKAAPQMNLLMLGFPIAIIVAFFILLVAIPVLMNNFGAIFENAFSILEEMLLEIRGGSI